LNEVTDDDVTNMNLDLLTIAKASNEFAVLVQGVQLEELFFLCVIVVRADHHDDENGQKDSEALNPTSSALFIVIGEAGFEADVNHGADEKQLEHEIVNGLLEELPIGGALRRVLSVGTELRDALVKVDRSETQLQVCLQLVGKCRNASEVLLQVVQVFHECSLLVCLNKS